MPLCLIVFDFMVYPDPKFLIFKTKKWPHLASFLSYVITQGICNKFIEMKISVGCKVWPWLRLFQHWTFVKYWWDISLECSSAKESEYRFKKYLNPFWLYLVSVHWSHPNINGSHKIHTWAWYKFGRGNKEIKRSWLILTNATTLQTSYDCLV